MGVVMQRAGSGKVTVEGLTADIVQAGKTVTVKQGSKVVQTVTGTVDRSICVYAAGGGYYLTPVGDGTYCDGGTFLQNCKVRYQVNWKAAAYRTLSWVGKRQ